MNKNQNGFSIVEILIILTVAFIFGAVGWFVFTHQKGVDKLANDDPGTAKNYVEVLAKNISLESTPVYRKSFDEGCKTSPAGSGLDSKTDKRCTYRHISVYSAPNQEALNEQKTKIELDNWRGNGQNVIMDTDYFRNNGATYYRYDGPLTKQTTLSVDYYESESMRNLENDINIANSYDSGKLDALTTVKSKLDETTVDLFIVDIKYEYFWNLD